jgi:hypothetical protein
MMLGDPDVVVAQRVQLLELREEVLVVLGDGAVQLGNVSIEIVRAESHRPRYLGGPSSSPSGQ